MSKIVSRILYSLVMFPLSAVVYTCLLLILMGESGWSDFPVVLAITTAVTWLFIMVYWTAVWFNAVTWTTRRVALGLLGVPTAALIAGLVGWLVTAFVYDDELGYIIASVTAAPLWVLSTIFAWQDRRHEFVARAGSILCPKCKYNMAGLRAPICPECGWSGTLDQLFAVQGADLVNDANQVASCTLR